MRKSSRMFVGLLAVIGFVFCMGTGTVFADENECIGPYTYETLNSDYVSIVDQQLVGNRALCDDQMLPEGMLITYLEQAWLAEGIGKKMKNKNRPDVVKLANSESTKVRTMVNVAEIRMNETYSELEGVKTGKSIRFKTWLDTKAKFEKYYKSHPMYNEMISKTSNNILKK
jgi:hypothetical protein